MDRALVQKAAAIDLELQAAEALMKALGERWTGDGPVGSIIRYKEHNITVLKNDMMLLLGPHIDRLRIRLADVGVDLKP